MKRYLFASLLAVAGTALPALSARAAAFPEHLITLIVPFSPGGASTILGRAVAQKMSEILGQTVVVENRVGAGGAVGMGQVARAKPDGYTLGLASVSTQVTNPACNPSLPYDPVKDFAPVTNLGNSPKIIAVNPAFPARDYREFLDLIQKNPGKYAYATAGICSLGHLFGEHFQSLTHTRLQHVPYRGGGSAMTDVMGNQVPILMDNLPPIAPLLAEGRLRAIALSWPQRLPSLPDVPTMAEIGLPAMNVPTWQGIVAPAGTPPAIIAILHDAAVKALHDPAVARVIRDTGAEPSGNTPEQFKQEIISQYTAMKSLVQSQHIELAD